MSLHRENSEPAESEAKEERRLSLFSLNESPLRRGLDDDERVCNGMLAGFRVLNDGILAAEGCVGAALLSARGRSGRLGCVDLLSQIGKRQAMHSS